MNLNEDDLKLLKQLCNSENISFKKVLKLLEIEKAYEFKDRRNGIYDALKEIVKTDYLKDK